MSADRLLQRARCERSPRGPPWRRRRALRLIGKIGWRLRGEQASRDDQQVGGDDAQPDVAVKGAQRAPQTARETEPTFEEGDVRLGAGSEVPQLPVLAAVVGHLFDG